jgi:OOP family OmpA-OmpF porin
MPQNDTFSVIRAFYTALVFAALGLLSVSPEAYAVGEKDGWYAGLGYGNYRIDNDNDLDNAFASLGLGVTTTTSADKSNDQYRFFAGYQFAKWFAAEVGYINMGTLRFSGTDSASNTYEGTYEADGVLANVILAVPIYSDLDRRVSLFLRGGAFRWDSVRRMSGTSSVVGPGSGHDHDINAHFGVGVHIRGLRHAAIRFGYERFKEVQGVDLNVVTLDLMYYY